MTNSVSESREIMSMLKSADQEYRDWTGASSAARGLAARGGYQRFPIVEADHPQSRSEDDRTTALSGGERKDEVSGNPPTLIYLDPRAFTRDCVGGWLQSSLDGFHVRLLPDPEQMESTVLSSGSVRAVIINTGLERMTSVPIADLLSRVKELLPGVPVAILSDHEDLDNVRDAFSLGVRGYIPTSVASLVAAGAVQLVCVGGTFAPAAALLSEGGTPRSPAAEPPLEGFTHRQTQILDCLRRGMANKLIAFELDMCESTVKVHIRNIMKKLKATNRTQVAYLTQGLFEGAHADQRV